MIEVQLLIIIWPVGPCGQSRRKPWWKLTSVVMTSSQIFSRPARINSVYKYILFILIPWQNLNANHRANDLVTLEGLDQVLTARFMYGPLDMVSLSGEKVMNSSWWSQYTLWLVLGTHVTSRHVTLCYVTALHGFKTHATLRPISCKTNAVRDLCTCVVLFLRFACT